MTTNMNHKVHEDHMLLISQLYPGVCQAAPQQGEAKPRRRRKKNKGGEANNLVGTKKRKLTAEQANLLELNFGDEHKLESERKDRLASELGLDPRQVAVWFQNRRARWKNKKLEEEYTKLKNAHDSVLVEKYRLESEVLKLKEQLSEKDKEIQVLTERIDGVSSISPSSSLSMEAINAPFFGEFGVEPGYVTDYSYINGMDQWINLYM